MKPEDYQTVMDAVAPDPELEERLRLEALCRKRPRRRSRAARVGLIAAAAVLALSVTAGAAYAVRNWAGIFEDYYSPTEENKTVLDEAMQELNFTETREGVTYTLRQIMGDTNSICLALDITLPEELRPAAVNIPELKALAEENGYRWDTAEDGSWGIVDVLKNRYGYDGTSETFAGCITLQGYCLGLGNVDEDALKAEMERTGDWNSAFYHLSSQLSDFSTASSRSLSQQYDPDTGTLSLLLAFTMDAEMIGKTFTLELDTLVIEDLMETYGTPNDDTNGGDDTDDAALLQKPLLFHFTADYTPYSAEYTVLQDGTAVGMLMLSPLSLYFSFPTEDTDAAYSSLEAAASRAGQKTYMYDTFYNAENSPVIVLKDGTEISTEPSSGAIGEEETAYFLPETLFSLEDIAEIRLDGFTFEAVK